MKDSEECGSHVPEEARRPDEAVADLHRALYREQMGERGYGSTGGRSRSLHIPSASSEEAKQLKTPGGFRRSFLNDRAEALGIPQEDRPPLWRRQISRTGLLRPLTRLDQFDAPMGIRMDPQTGQELPADEGSCGLTPTALAIVKSFVGSGITFMPGAFSQGGWLFSSVILVIIAAANGLCIHLLIQCQDKQVSPRASFACIADSACGWVGKLAVQVSLVISQFGVCVAYIIFISTLVQSIGSVGSPLVMCVLFPVLVPLCLIRSVDKLEYPNLIADTLILFGLVVVLVFGCIHMATTNAIENMIASMPSIHDMRLSKMIAPNNHTVVPFKPETCGIFIGMAIFAFEGVPMVLPIRNAMAKSERFISLFMAVFVGIIMLFCFFGIMGYISYKDKVETVVLLNLPDDSILSLMVKFGYMLALCFSTPLMFLPAARITELWAFGASEDDPDKDGDRVWLINSMRTFEVLVFCMIAVLCGPFFDRFLAFIGALCCAPVAFVYPALFHLVLCAGSAAGKALDILLLLFGFCAMGFALASAIFAD